MTGVVADIQRASFHDGEGVRTTVFLKGCPLNCIWCHNPECISKELQELFYPEKCIGCNMCENGCYSGARTICGREYTPDELWERISTAVEAAFEDFFAMKQREGKKLGEDILSKLEFISSFVDTIEKEAPNVVEEYSKRNRRFGGV